MKRVLYLDNLRILLILLVIFHHAGCGYNPYMTWYYNPSNPEEYMPWMWPFLSINAAFTMGFFFMIAGYFVPMSFDKQGTRLFLKKKFIRLGIPMLVFSLCLSLAYKRFDFFHLWFLENLLFFCLVYALIRTLCMPIRRKGNSKPTVFSVFIIGLVMGFMSHCIRKVSPQDNFIFAFNILEMEPAHYPQYTMMFILGILSYRFSWFEKMTNRTGKAALMIGVALVIGNWLRHIASWHAFITPWYGIYESLMCVFVITGLLWLFREYANCSNCFWSWCASQTYGAYIFHIMILYYLLLSLDSVWMWGGEIKFLLIGTVTTAASFILTWLIKKIPGIDKIL